MWSEQCSTDRCDALPLQVHEWFWRETFPLRPLSEMIETYHHSVGNNGVLELDFAIDDTGNVHPTHAAEYKVHGAAGGWREGGGQMAGGWRTVAAGPRLGFRLSHASFFSSQALGDWARNCYGAAVANTSGSDTSLTLKLPQATQVG